MKGSLEQVGRQSKDARLHCTVNKQNAKSCIGSVAILPRLAWPPHLPRCMA